MNKDYRIRKVIKKVLEKKNSKRKYVLNPEKWGEFRIGDLFDVEMAKSSDVGNLEDGNIPFVGRSEDNNGIQKYVEVPSNKITIGKCITISMVGTNVALWQELDFAASQNIVTLRNKDLNSINSMFINTIINSEIKEKFYYGRTVTKEKTVDMVIKLPATKEGKPNWEWMEGYIKSLNCKPLTTTKKKEDTLKLDPEKWGEFRVGDLFDIHPTKSIPGVTASDCEEGGKYPLIVNSSENNGIAGFCNLPYTEEGNIITFSDTTNGDSFYYQKNKFIGFSHVQGMYPKNFEMNKYIGLFLSNILMFSNKGLYNYGRKIRREKFVEGVIKLPITEEGTPDWKWMEDYIKSLPYGDRL